VIGGERIGRTLYHLAITVDPPYDWVCFATPAPPSIDVRHQRLAHTSVKKIRKKASLDMVDGLILLMTSQSISLVRVACAKKCNDQNSNLVEQEQHKWDNLSIPMYVVQYTLLHQENPNTLFFLLTSRQ
jgi:hypothetical protein